MINLLSAQDKKTVNRIFERGGGQLTREAYFRQQFAESQNQIYKKPHMYSGRSRYDVHVENLRNSLKCSVEEAEALVVGDVYGSDLVARGVARRITKNAPAELSCALSLAARLEWIRAAAPGCPASDKAYQAWEILKALAAKDIDVAQAFFRGATRRISAGHRPSVVTYNALMGILTSNDRVKKAIVPELLRHDAPLPIRAVHTTLAGIIENEVEWVAYGLDQVIRKCRVFYLHGGPPLAYEQIVAFNAHGLAELALWSSPKLLSSFNIDQPLPWDSTYFRSLRKPTRSSSYLDLSKHSVLLTKWISDLSTPSWWQE